MDDPPSTAKIIEIRNAPRGRQRVIVLDDGREFLFSEEACERLGVAEADIADPALLEALDAAEQHVNAHEAALRLLSYRARSEHEMRTRLTMRGIASTVVEEEIERLRRAGLLDDEKFARAWVEDRKRIAPRGRRMLRYELLGRGIEAESVENVTRDIDDHETALDLARNRARKISTTDYGSFFGKMTGFLQRRGFDYEVTAAATKTAWEELHRERDSGADDAVETTA